MHHRLTYSNWVIIAIVLLVAPFKLFAQNNKATLQVDTAYLRLGQQTLLTFDLECRKDLKPIVPDWSKLLEKKLEIIQSGTLDTISDATSSQLKLRQEMVVAKFNEDTVVIDPGIVPLIKNRDTVRLEITPLVIYPVLEEVDMNQPIRDIKGPEDIPFSIMEILPYILLFIGVVIFIFLIILIVRIIRRRKKREAPVIVVEVPKVIVPAHEIALMKLQRMKLEEEWQTDDSKRFMIQLTEVIREYIHNRWDFLAIESTSTDILAGDYVKSIEHESLQHLKDVLSISDMVKFAKAKTSLEENKMLLDKCILFVEATRKPDIEKLDG